MVDTNVVAAAAFGEPNTGEEALLLLESRWELLAPSHWKAEFSNVVWKAVRIKRVAVEEIELILDRVRAFAVESVDVEELWSGALARAIDADHPAYDTLFVELAVRLKTRVASFDGGLQRKFPSIVMRPNALLA